MYYSIHLLCNLDAGRVLYNNVSLWGIFKYIDYFSKSAASGVVTNRNMSSDQKQIILGL